MDHNSQIQLSMNPVFIAIDIVIILQWYKKNYYFLPFLIKSFYYPILLISSCTLKIYLLLSIFVQF